MDPLVDPALPVYRDVSVRRTFGIPRILRSRGLPLVRVSAAIVERVPVARPGGGGCADVGGCHSHLCGARGRHHAPDPLARAAASARDAPTPARRLLFA